MIESRLRGELVGREIKQRQGRIGVSRNGHAVSRGESREERVGDKEMCILQEIDGWSRFHVQQNLGGLLDGGKFGDGLFRAIVENVKFLALQALDEFSMNVGDDDANIHPLDVDANGLRRRGSLFLSL